MKILAVDSCTDILSICVNEDTTLLGEYTIKNLRTHSPKIVPMIDELLKNLEIDIKDIDLFVTGIGPGSFTGIRIGMSVLKSMAQANNKPIIGISTLINLAKNISFTDSLICPMIDAKNDNIYTCIFDNKYNLVLDYCSFNIEELISVCKNQTKPIYFIGNGAILHNDLICKNLDMQKVTCIQDSYLSAKNIAILGYEKYLKNEIDDIYSLSPMYLKSSSAERLCKND